MNTAADHRDRPARRSSDLLLGGSLVLLELIAGIQVYVQSTVLPLLAQQLGGRQLYGTATAATQVAVFLAMPLAPALRNRWGASRVLTWLTPVTVLAACVAASAPTMWVWIGARVVAGLCSGAMSGIGMGVIATDLSAGTRRFVLAAMNLMWVISSLVGPAYAAWLSQAFSWRVALVAYLPVLVLARAMIVRELRRRPSDSTRASTRLPLLDAALLAGGVALLGARPLATPLGMVCAALGLLLVGWGARRLLPSGTLRLGTPGAPAALRTLVLAAAQLFGAEAILTIVAHDQLGFTTGQLGLLLMVGGLAWAVLGLVTAWRPASVARFRWQGPVAHAVLAAGLLLLCLATVTRSTATAHAQVYAGWLVANIGMGMVYLDAMNLVLDPAIVAPIAATVAGGALALGEPLASAVTSTLASGWVASRPGGGGAAFAVLALLSVPGAWSAIRAAGRAHRASAASTTTG